MEIVRFIALLVLLPVSLNAQETVIIRVRANVAEGPLRPVWAYFGHDEPNYTYTQYGKELLSDFTAMSPYLVHIRTHNLLTSGDGTPALKWGSTNAYTEDAGGRPVYNWTILDRIFDTYRTMSITPYVEIGFMPEALSTHPEPYQHHWPTGLLFTGWSYPPKDYHKWEELIYQWVRHSVERYGKETVENWDWEVWNEPNGGRGYWHGTLDEYCKLYDYTAAGVKRALPTARVGGPAVTGPAGEGAAAFLRGFLEHCAHGTNYATGKTGSPIDFISFHAKGRTRLAAGHVEMDIGQNLKDIDHGFAIVHKFARLRSLPVVISESDPEGCAACLAATHPQNGYRNTSQYAGYEAELLRRTTELARRYQANLQGAVTWAFEFENQPYFAGFRALETRGVDKPVMDLFRMLGLMGGERVAATSSGALGLDSLLGRSAPAEPDIDVLAARRDHEVSVLVWNYRDDEVPAPAANIEVNVEGISGPPERVLVEHYRIDREASNSYSAWKAMGSPQEPTSEEYARLRAAGELHLLASPKWLKPEGKEIKLRFPLPTEGVSLLRLTW